MIQSVSPIEKEFLIKTVYQNEHPVRLHGVSTAGTGKITNVDRQGMFVTLTETYDNANFSLFEHITGYFDCHGNTYAFETTIRDSADKQIRIDAPDTLLRSLQRKYVRVKKPQNIKVAFSLANEDIQLEYPICPEYISVDENTSAISSSSDLTKVIAEFRERMNAYCTGNTIQMFRNRAPHSFEEKLLTKTGKVLFIPSTSAELPKTDPYPEGRIITQAIEESYEDPNHFVEGTHFSKLMKEKSAKGISSEIWCPIVYYQYVVGYIYAVKSGSDSFDIAMVDSLWDFSRILAYQLKKTGYFKCEEKKQKPIHHPAELIDMSPGGMHIALDQSNSKFPIREGSIFSIRIMTGTQEIQCTTKVVRRYSRKDSISYGTVFLDLSSEQFMHLYECLYRSPYNEYDPRAHEQSRKKAKTSF